MKSKKLHASILYKKAYSVGPYAHFFAKCMENRVKILRIFAKNGNNSTPDHSLDLKIGPGV